MKKRGNLHLLGVAVVTVTAVVPLRQALLAEHAPAHAALQCRAPAAMHGVLEASCLMRPTRQKLDTAPYRRGVAGRLWV